MTATKKAAPADGPAPEVALGVAVVRPAALRDRAAAAYLGMSTAWLRAKRLADTKMRREGRPPTGPTWITLGSTVLYRLTDLDAWVAANAVERGVVSFSNRGAKGQ